MKARYIEFGDGGAPGSSVSRPMFSDGTPSRSPLKDGGKRGKKLKAADLLAQRKSHFQEQLRGNTRAAVDPFLGGDEAWKPAPKVRQQMEPPKVEHKPALVDYDSD